MKIHLQLDSPHKEKYKAKSLKDDCEIHIIIRREKLQLFLGEKKNEYLWHSDRNKKCKKNQECQRWLKMN